MIWPQRALLCDFDARAAVQPALFRPSAVLYTAPSCNPPWFDGPWTPGGRIYSRLDRESRSNAV